MRPRDLVALSILAATMAAPLACNVFLTVDRCSSDSDCPSGFACDGQGRFCIDRRLEAGPPDAGDPGTDADPPDASPDVHVPPSPPRCDLGDPFGPAMLLAGLDQLSVHSGRLSEDETTLLFSASQPTCVEERCADLYFARREHRDAPFTIGGLLPGKNMSSPQASEYWPTMTADGLLLFFESARSVEKVDGGHESDRSRIWNAIRPNTIATFGEPYVQPVFDEIAETEGSPYIHPNGTSLYFMSGGRVGNKGLTDIFVAKLNEFGGASSVTNIEAINTPAAESAPVVSLDDEVLYFAREDASSRRHIMVSSRGSVDASFGAARLVEELKSADEDFPTYMSSDQCRLYFVSNRVTPDSATKVFRLWMAERQR